MIERNFRIFALMTVKNESDIIIETLNHASKWADKIYILDNMSSDNTWDLISEYAKHNDKIELWGRYGGRFYLALRQVIFKDYKNNASEGDWWCRLDGDEFYIDDPRLFLAGLDDKTDHVYNASFQYYYTEDDYREELSADNVVLPTERLKWYKCNHSEIRFIKHKKFTCWPQNSEWPCDLVRPTKSRIRLKHYQYRSLQQISSRLLLRNASDSGSSFTHEKLSIKEWYSRRKFTMPDNPELANYRVVQKTELDNSKDFIIDDAVLYPIKMVSVKKYLRSFISYFYMKFLNRFLFKI
ncbi:glycosyltransferase family 2 protein [Klebsiella michiganensis]|uniref:glycosyltransferase family 2 protein n=1 Tax=Klebsiella michiganensis TaxID=1134687 RepID=UPI004069147B